MSVTATFNLLKEDENKPQPSRLVNDYFETHCNISKFDKYKLGDSVYIINTSRIQIGGDVVEIPARIEEMIINKICYDIPDNALLFSENYKSINFYLSLSLISKENKSDFFGETTSSLATAITLGKSVDVYYNVSPKNGYEIPGMKKGILNKIFNYNPNLSIDYNKVISIDESQLEILEIRDKTKKQEIFITKDEAMKAFKEASNDAARKILYSLEKEASVIRFDYTKLRYSLEKQVENTKFLNKFIKTQCTKDFEASIHSTDDWLFIHLNHMLLEDERSS